MGCKISDALSVVMVLVVVLWLAFLCDSKNLVTYNITITEEGRMFSDYGQSIAASNVSKQLSKEESSSKAGFRMHLHHVHHPQLSSFEAPLHAAYNYNQFLTTLYLGTPPQSISVIVDTGSDLVWTQCQPCKNNSCYKQPLPMYDSLSSSSYAELSCKHNKYCSFLQGLGSSCCNHDKKCVYSYAYDGGAYTEGILSTETLMLTDFSKGSSGIMRSFPKFVFGCGKYNRAIYNYANSSGIVGLGRNVLSLNSQLGSIIDYKFSYCLVPYNVSPSITSTLLLGEKSMVSGPGTISTPLISKRAYYVDLQGISVGGERLDIPKGTFDHADGNYGVLVDSGTSFSQFAEAAYKVVITAFKHHMNLQMMETTANILHDKFELCYKKPKAGRHKVPTLDLHFRNSDLALPPENYFIEMNGALCLAMKSTPDDTISILGNFQQQNLHIGFDCKANLLFIKPTACAKV